MTTSRGGAETKFNDCSTRQNLVLDFDYENDKLWMKETKFIGDFTQQYGYFECGILARITAQNPHQKKSARNPKKQNQHRIHFLWWQGMIIVVFPLH